MKGPAIGYVPYRLDPRVSIPDPQLMIITFQERFLPLRLNKEDYIIILLELFIFH